MVEEGIVEHKVPMGRMPLAASNFWFCWVGFQFTPMREGPYCRWPSFFCYPEVGQDDFTKKSNSHHDIKILQSVNATATMKCT